MLRQLSLSCHRGGLFLRFAPTQECRSKTATKVPAHDAVNEAGNILRFPSHASPFPALVLVLGLVVVRP
jgi:hypothetical protein